MEYRYTRHVSDFFTKKLLQWILILVCFFREYAMAKKEKNINNLFKNIGLVPRRETEEIRPIFNELARFLLDKNINVFIEEETVSYLDKDIRDRCRLLEKAMLKLCDLMIILGGDGTLLSVARKVAPYKVPLLGVNQGRLGFMTDIPKERMFDILPKILDGAFISEKRILLEATVFRNNEEIARSLALNDVVFNRGYTGQMIEFEVFIDDSFVYSQRSDGLIVSTPTGSTAYSLSAGGPIVHSTLPAITLVPICPQSLSNRPIVVNDNVEVCVILTRKEGDTLVHFDGQSQVELREADKIIIRRFESTLRILHPQGYDYYNTLRQKLHWGGRLV